MAKDIQFKNWPKTFSMFCYDFIKHYLKIHTQQKWISDPSIFCFKWHKTRADHILSPFEPAPEQSGLTSRWPKSWPPGRAQRQQTSCLCQSGVLFSYPRSDLKKQLNMLTSYCLNINYAQSSTVVLWSWQMHSEQPDGELWAMVSHGRIWGVTRELVL